MRRLRWNFPMRPPVYVVNSPDPEPDVVEEVEDGDAAAGFRTRRHYWRGIVWLLIAFGVQAFAALVPDVVERVYSKGIYFYLSRALAIPSKVVGNIVIGELLFLFLLAYFFFWGVWYLNRSLRRQARLLHVIKLFFLHVLWVFSILFPIFLAVWGLNYQREALADTMGLERRPAARTGELDTIGLQLINGVNTNYDRARAGQNWAAASTLPMSVPKLHQVIESAFQAETALGTASQGGFADPKPLQLSRLASLMGVSGFYIAYTTEVTYNSEVPAVDLPIVIAHHKAHQRGYAREDEANFIAFLICSKATDPYVRYSGFMHALRVLEPLNKTDQAKYAQTLSRLDPGPRADLRQRLEFWGTTKNGYLGAASRRLFDMYLRANRVQGGVKNYDEDIYLLTSYFLHNLSGLPPVETQAASPAASPTAPPAATPTPDLSEPIR